MDLAMTNDLLCSGILEVIQVTVLFACIENVSTAFSFNYHERLLELVMCISLAAIEQQISGQHITYLTV
ncbi:hypothetical protein ACE6H2_024550 [Prunus campanulata]